MFDFVQALGDLASPKRNALATEMARASFIQADCGFFEPRGQPEISRGGSPS